jgi:hypothetical protein
MKKQTFYTFSILFLVIYLVPATFLFAQIPDEPLATQITTQKDKDDSELNGYLKIMVNGKEVYVGENVRLAKIINGGKDVIFDGGSNSGSGGYENEGESLWVYSVKHKSKRKVLSSYYIDALTEAKLSDGKSAIVVRMSDGGAGNSYISVVDPTRGEVFFRKFAEVLDIKGDNLTLNLFKDGSWDYDATTEEDKFKRKENIFLIKSDPKPDQTKKYNLKKIIENNGVIYNELDIEKYFPEYKDLKRVEIYLWRYNDVFKNQNFVLSPVPRYVEPKAPLKPTLEALFGKVKKEEEDYGFGSPVFGMKFEGVVLKKGTAVIKFSQPKNQTNYRTLGPFIFLDAIRKTAKQFPSVKRVEICAIGTTLIDSQLDKQFPGCSN